MKIFLMALVVVLTSTGSRARAEGQEFLIRQKLESSDVITRDVNLSLVSTEAGKGAANVSSPLGARAVFELQGRFATRKCSVSELSARLVYDEEQSTATHAVARLEFIGTEAPRAAKDDFPVNLSGAACGRGTDAAFKFPFEVTVTRWNAGATAHSWTYILPAVHASRERKLVVTYHLKNGWSFDF